MKAAVARNAHEYIFAPQDCTGQSLWHSESSEVDPGWEGYYFAGALVGEVFPAPHQPQRWKWVSWLGATSEGIASSHEEARASLHLDFLRRPVSEVTDLFES